MTMDPKNLPGFLKKPAKVGPLYHAHLEHQIAWKERFNTSCLIGKNGSRVRWYFHPEDQDQNLHFSYRKAMMDHVNLKRPEDEKIILHTGFGNVLSSQAFAMNLIGPFMRAPEKLKPVLQALAPDSIGIEVETVDKVDIEVVGPSNYFNEPGSRGKGRSSPDLGVWWRSGGEPRLLLMEVKYTEPDFGVCRSGEQGFPACDRRGAELFAGGDKECPKTTDNRPYWKLMKELEVFNEERIGNSLCCPFRFEGYQLMRYQLLAAVIEKDPAADERRVDFVTLCHPDNELLRKFTLPIDGENEVSKLWPTLLKRPERFHAWSARDWVFQAGIDPDLAEWATWMTTRYFP